MRSPGSLSKFGTPVQEIRESLGQFSGIKTVAKKMARLAQCFTQSQEVCEVGKSGLREVEDVESWTGNPNGGGPYKFSDGVGRMPVRLARKVQAALRIPYLPSAFQVYPHVCQANPKCTPRNSTRAQRKSNKQMPLISSQIRLRLNS